MSEEAKTVAEFIKKAKLDATYEPHLLNFLAYLKQQGKLITDGDLKKQFLEKKTVDAKGGEKITVEHCAICGSQQYEVGD